MLFAGKNTPSSSGETSCREDRIGDEGGGEAAAIAYALVETAKLNGVDPQAWFTDVLSRIADHRITRIEKLLPWRYAATAA